MTTGKLYHLERMTNPMNRALHCGQAIGRRTKTTNDPARTTCKRCLTRATRKAAVARSKERVL